ncbi:MAG: serine/threonine protein kinase [Chloroflexi bacterium]|nr:serine/threonine protein kinase [Chloroflexota bacterium]
MGDPMLNTAFGQYQILERLGAGGVAVVYKALDTHNEQTVALKILNPTWDENSDMARRFKRESEIMMRLKHPHIVAVTAAGTFENRTYSVVEYMKGGSLAQRFHDPARISFQTTSKILRQIGSALDYAHTLGIVHRDIKLENILLGERGAALSDFGIARLTRAAKVTVTGSIVGTPLYIAPEQARGKGTVDHRADIYSLGVLCYLLIVGCFPFNGDDVLAILGQHLNAPVPVPSTINAEIPHSADVVLLKALAKQPESRFNKASEFIETLIVAMNQSALRQTLVDVNFMRAFTPTPSPAGIEKMETVKQEGEIFTADQLVEMAKAANTDADKIAYLRRALEVAPMHSEANRLLFRLEGAKPKGAAAIPPSVPPAVPSPMPAASPSDAHPLPQIERKLRKDSHQERLKRQRTWTRLGCFFSIILAFSCSLTTLRLIGLAPQFFTQIKQAAGGPTPVTRIDGQPIQNVPNAPLYVEPEKTVNLSAAEQQQAVDVLDPGYAHEYVFEARAGRLIAIYIQFMSVSASNVSAHIVVIDPNGSAAEDFCFRENGPLRGDATGVIITCRPTIAGAWRVRILGVAGESNGAYFVATAELDG